MTKEEFESIFSRRLEELQKELEKVNAKIEYEHALWGTYGETYDAEVRKEALQYEINYIEEFINIPAYERIMAMSDAEIEAYKKEKIEGFDSKIETLTAKIEKEKEEVKELEKLDEANALKYAEAKDDFEKKQILSEGRKIADKISALKDTIAKDSSEIGQLGGRRAKMFSKTSDEVKQMFVDKLTLGDYAAKQSLTMARMKNDNVDSQDRLLASVNGDPEKTEALINALSNLSSIRENSYPYMKKVTIKIGDLPYDLQRLIKDAKSIETVRSVEDIDKILDVINKYLNEMSEESKLIHTQFTDEKMRPIFGIGEQAMREDTEEVNFDFLEKHIDKINQKDIEYLKALTEEKKKWDRKRFKTKNVRDELEYINTQIKAIRDKAYYRIERWYEKTYETKLPKSTRDRGPYTSSTIGSDYIIRIDELIKNVNSRMMTIEKVKTEIENAKERREAEIAAYEASYTKAQDRVLEIVGPDFTRKDIPHIDQNRIFELRTRIETSAFRVKTAETVKDVKQEAQKQADEKEAELRGITLEQLMQLRAQATAAKEAQEPTNNPGGMTM